MAMRRPVGRITPTTRGVDRSTQARPVTKPNAFMPPKPRAVSDDDLYSRPQDVPQTGRRTVRSAEALAAATARMNAIPPDNLDDLGESTFGMGHEESQRESEGREQDEQPDRRNPDPSRFVARADVEAMIKQGILEYAQLQQQAQAQAQARTSPPVLVTPNALVTPKAQPGTELVALAVTPEDTDRLWDWIRQSPDSAQRFFGLVPTNAGQLYRIMGALADAESQGISILRAMHVNHADGKVEHLGFGMLAPILGADKLAVIHLYLSPARRGMLAQLTPAMLDLTAQHLPGFKFAIVPEDATQARLYGQVLTPRGFTTHTMFVR